MRRLLFYCFALFLFSFFHSCKTTQTTSEQANIVEIIFLQINDVYEIAPLEGGKLGGMARVAQLRQELLKENPNTYTFVAGDFLNPSVIGTVKLNGSRIKGAHMVDVMNRVGVDVVTFGNHEFDLSEEDLQKRLNESNFVWVGGNVSHQTQSGHVPFESSKNGKTDKVPPYYILEVPSQSSSLKIGILSTCIRVNDPDYVHLADPYESAANHFNEIKSQSDFVVGLTHLAINGDEKLAAQLPEIPLIMGGHEHINISRKVGKTYITKADANAKSAYVHRISYNKRTKKITINSKLRVLNETVPLHPEIAELVKEWETKAYKAFKDQGFDLETPITILKEPLDGREFMIRNEPTNLGKTIAQAMYEAYPQTDLALFNSGSVRLDDQLVGAITEFDLIRTLPYGGEVLLVEMKGSLLSKVLNTGLMNKDKGGYLQTYGVNKNDNQWFIKDSPLEDPKMYNVSIPAFLLTGLEENFGYLTEQNSEIQSILKPSSTDIQRDVRLVLADFLKKQ